MTAQSQITKLPKPSGTACLEAAEQGHPTLGASDCSQQLGGVTLAMLLAVAFPVLYEFSQPPRRAVSALSI